jgi:hypothetical protein
MLFGRCLIECDLEAPKNKPIEKVGEIRDDTEQKVGSLQQILLKAAGSMLSFLYFVYMLRRHKIYHIRFNS